MAPSFHSHWHWGKHVATSWQCGFNRVFTSVCENRKKVSKQNCKKIMKWLLVLLFRKCISIRTYTYSCLCTLSFAAAFKNLFNVLWHTICALYNLLLIKCECYFFVVFVIVFENLLKSPIESSGRIFCITFFCHIIMECICFVIKTVGWSLFFFILLHFPKLGPSEAWISYNVPDIINNVDDFSLLHGVENKWYSSDRRIFSSQ